MLSCMLAVFGTNLTVGNIDASSLLLLLLLTLQLRKVSFILRPPFQKHESQLRSCLHKEVKRATAFKLTLLVFTHQLRVQILMVS